VSVNLFDQPELVTQIRDAFRRNDHGWDGQI
jgi:hypothetical protein